MSEPVPIILRRDKEGNVFALFPTLAADNLGILCTCYERVGGHSSADYFLCIAESRPATSEESVDLIQELCSRGYTLAIRRRASYVMHQNRQKQGE